MAGRPAVESLAATMQNATAVVIPRASHFAWVENPAEYSDAVESFLHQHVHV
jgi:pimeloyl-ACP methyl ester carboxylesterase